MRPLKITEQITDRREQGLDTYLREVAKIKMLTEEEEKEIATKAMQGDEKAIERLTKANLRFAISVAKQYQNKKVPLIELINAANQGLYESAKTFDPTLGNKFISYAVWKTRARVIEHLNKYTDTIYVPGKKKDNIRNLKRVINRLEQELERDPTIDEVYEAVSDEYTYDQVEVLIDSNNLNVTSYDAQYTDDGFTLLDTISGENKADYIITNSDFREKFDSLLNLLSPKERDIITRVYGIDCEKEDLKDIGDSWNITASTVSNARNKALRRMSRAIRYNRLENFFKTLKDG
jgi:RNA polymerase primary sigma factor